MNLTVFLIFALAMCATCQQCPPVKCLPLKGCFYIENGCLKCSSKSTCSPDAIFFPDSNRLCRNTTAVCLNKHGCVEIDGNDCPVCMKECPRKCPKKFCSKEKGCSDMITDKNGCEICKPGCKCPEPRGCNRARGCTYEDERGCVRCREWC